MVGCGAIICGSRSDDVSDLSTLPFRVVTAVWTSGEDPTAVWRVLGDLIARWDALPAQGHDLGVWFAARGPERVWGGEAAMAHRLLQRLGDAGAMDIGVAVAPGRLLSWVLAHQSRRGSEPVLLGDDDAVEVHRRLPVTVLCQPGSPAGLHADLVGRLARLGLRSLGDLAAVPLAHLVGRFGEPGHRAHRWASGVEPPAGGVAPSVEISVQQEFSPPAEHAEAVVFAGRRLAEELDRRLVRRGEVVTAVGIHLHTDHGEHRERVWSHVDGLRPAAMVDRLRWQLQGWHAGPVVLLRLVVVEVDGERSRQSGWWGGEAHGDDRAGRAVARVVGLLGSDAVGQLVWRGGRDPVECYERLPVSSDRMRQASPSGVAPWPGGLPSPSPARVWRQPAAVDLCDARGRTVIVSARGELSAPPGRLVAADGTTREVVAWAGPWPLEERWWQPGEHRRQARLQIVTDDGEALLVFRQQQRWWLRASYR